MSDVEVRGGVGGVEVFYEELRLTSARLHEEGGSLLALAAERRRLLTDGDLLASAVLHPLGAARVESALLAALVGPSGVVAAAAALELRAGQLLVAVARYRGADRLEEQAVGLRRWLLGATAPLSLPLVLAAGLGLGACVAVTGGDPEEVLQQVLLQHPGVVDEVVGSVAGLTAPARSGLLGPLPVLAHSLFRARTGTALLPRDLEESAALLALLYLPGEPVLTSRPDTAPVATRVPAGLGDVLARLHHRDRQATVGQGTQGDIGLTRIRRAGPDGQALTSWIVDLPGTKDWQVDPGSRPALNDLASNLELMAGADNARVRAVEDVLRTAGAGAGDPIMLVGHSQGGLVAMRAAQQLSGRFAVTHVVTAGSPVGTMPTPPGVQVLSLENRHDLVPHADGRENPEPAGHVTVLFTQHAPTVAETHALGTAYLPAAQQLDRTSDVSVRAWLDSADAFLAAPPEAAAAAGPAAITATTTVHTVTNAPPLR